MGDHVQCGAWWASLDNASWEPHNTGTELGLHTLETLPHLTSGRPEGQSREVLPEAS